MSDPQSDLPPQVQGQDERPHKPADDREEIYFQGSPLVRGQLARALWLCLIGIVLIALPFFLHAKTGRWLPWYVVLASIIIGLFLLALPVLMAKFVRYRISNYRIDYERGFLSRNIDTLELWHVEDLNFHQSLMNRILGVGTITVISHDETTPKLELKSIPQPRPLFETLKQR